MLNSSQKRTASKEPITLVTIVAVMIVFLATASLSSASTLGLNQIPTPDMPPQGDLLLGFQGADQKIGNPYQLQAQLGVTKWFEIAIYKGLEPNELIFNTEIGLLMKEPYLLAIGFSNWSPHSHVDPLPYIEAGYWGKHHKFTAGFARADFHNEAILGYAYDFNDTWRLQVDFQSGPTNSSTIGFVWSITPDFQVSPSMYVTNDSPHEVLGLIAVSYTFHFRADRK